MTLIYIFSLFVILTPGFLYKQNLNINTYLLNSILFIIFFALTFPLVKSVQEGYSKYTIQLNGVDNFIEILEKYLQQGKIAKTVNINSDFNKYKCTKELEKLKDENKLLKKKDF